MESNWLEESKLEILKSTKYKRSNKLCIYTSNKTDWTTDEFTNPVQTHIEIAHDEFI